MQNSATNKKLPVDLDSVIRSQESKFFKNMPQFIVNIIKKIIKQKELNQYIIKNQQLSGIEFCNACMKDLGTKYDVVNEENIPDKGRFIFVANHPLGGADVGAVFVVMYRKFKKIRAVANDFLANVENLKDVMIEVGVFAKTDIKAIKKMNEIYASDDIQILIMPAGMVSRKSKGVIRDLPWKHSFVKNAVKYKRDVIPVFVDTRNRRMFYFIAQVRKFLRIKLSLETMLIPREYFNKKNKTIKLIVGKPIPYQTFDKSKSPRNWALTVQEMVYNFKHTAETN